VTDALEQAAVALAPQPGPPPPPDATVADAFAALAVQVREEVSRPIRVPRYDPPVWVQVRPLSEEEYSTSLSGRTAQPDHRFRVLHAADLLVRACTGIFLTVGDRKVALNPHDPDGPWPTFSVDLQPFLGVDAGDEAVDWVLALFRTEPDVIAAAEELVRWSGYGNAQVKEQLAGE
jgi:hypothetical protein